MRLESLCCFNPLLLWQELNEDLNPSIKEKIAYLAMMAARQGKDPDPIVKQIRARLDPQYAALETGKERFVQWLRQAQSGESKDAIAYGRRLTITVKDTSNKATTETQRMPAMDTGAPAGIHYGTAKTQRMPAMDTGAPAGIHYGTAKTQRMTPVQDEIGRKTVMTVIEARIKNVLCEAGFLSNIGQMIVTKLRQMIGDDAPESAKTKAALDEFPGLAAVIRYARSAKSAVDKDPGFWELVDKVTNGKATHIRPIVDNLYEIEESRLNQPCIIHEAHMSEVMAALGMNRAEIVRILQTYDLEDTDYDLDRLKAILRSVGGSLKQALGKMRQATAGALRAKSSETQKQAMSGGADDNSRYALLVVKTAAALMRVEREVKARTTSPEQKEQIKTAVDRATTKVAQDPSVIEKQDLTGEATPFSA